MLEELLEDDANLLGILFIDLVLVKATDVTDALARNTNRTNKGCLWPLYVDPQTYAILLRCILYGESVADQGYTWREVFAHYRLIIDELPRLGLIKSTVGSNLSTLANSKELKHESYSTHHQYEWISKALEELRTQYHV